MGGAVKRRAWYNPYCFVVNRHIGPCPVSLFGHRIDKKSKALAAAFEGIDGKEIDFAAISLAKRFPGSRTKNLLVLQNGDIGGHIPPTVQFGDTDPLCRPSFYQNRRGQRMKFAAKITANVTTIRNHRTFTILFSKPHLDLENTTIANSATINKD